MRYFVVVLHLISVCCTPPSAPPLGPPQPPPSAPPLPPPSEDTSVQVITASWSVTGLEVTAANFDAFAAKVEGLYPTGTDYTVTQVSTGEISVTFSDSLTTEQYMAQLKQQFFDFFDNPSGELSKVVVTQVTSRRRRLQNAAFKYVLTIDLADSTAAGYANDVQNALTASSQASDFNSDPFLKSVADSTPATGVQMDSAPVEEISVEYTVTVSASSEGALADVEDNMCAGLPDSNEVEKALSELAGEQVLLNEGVVSGAGCDDESSGGGGGDKFEDNVFAMAMTIGGGSLLVLGGLVGFVYIRHLGKHRVAALDSQAKAEAEYGHKDTRATTPPSGAKVHPEPVNDSESKVEGETGGMEVQDFTE